MATFPGTSWSWKRLVASIDKGYEGKRPRTWVLTTKTGRRALSDEVASLGSSE